MIFVEILLLRDYSTYESTRKNQRWGHPLSVLYCENLLKTLWTVSTKANSNQILSFVVILVEIWIFFENDPTLDF